MVFDHEPDEEDWDKLGSTFNATCIDDAGGYTTEEYAYWVRVSRGSPEDLNRVADVSDVLVLRGTSQIPGGFEG